jgi:ubiquinone/menaquinone biosynthesis C-methylase UbiE
LEKRHRLVIPLDRQLELGSGSGEHLPFVKKIPNKAYVCLDLNLPSTKEWIKKSSPQLQTVLQFIKANAENIPFEDQSFERLTGTCLLHHVQNPLAVLIESRRVCKVEGEIVFIMPTDPGIFNQTVKRLVTYRRMKKFTHHKPQLILALDHINTVNSIIELAKFVFKDDDLKIDYLPFRIKSWNFNLIVRLRIIKKHI